MKTKMLDNFALTSVSPMTGIVKDIANEYIMSAPETAVSAPHLAANVNTPSVSEPIAPAA